MSNEYIKKEVQKILNDEKLEAPLNIAMAAAWIIANFKGINIKILDTKGTSSLCDYNIIATAENTIQAKSMIDEFLRNLKPENEEVRSLEGVEDGEWMLLDLGDVIIHIFQENSREIFDLDGLWRDLDQISIPQEYYFGEDEISQNKSNSPESYF